MPNDPDQLTACQIDLGSCVSKMCFHLSVEFSHGTAFSGLTVLMTLDVMLVLYSACPRLDHDCIAGQ